VTSTPVNDWYDPFDPATPADGISATRTPTPPAASPNAGSATQVPNEGGNQGTTAMSNGNVQGNQIRPPSTGSGGLK
jgi:hypothetical protein